ncbi:hypothetical protein C4J89_3664 [Pseudomonas sp. R4-35-07]|uniref:hypothetical protein n=1 Tax=Pseudomonas sp. R4-35-07 TaxID=658643 RepID=UPI000F713B37|nr:hypothetical protein [Pseudomonas sp. R4-35-07]AZF33122.1 hypothetical protein C4J89_3664 [Pseudomonas sp. R4-35-07]
MTAPTVRIDSSDQKHWVRDGYVNAPRIVYLSSDPNCPTLEEHEGASNGSKLKGRRRRISW